MVGLSPVSPTSCPLQPRMVGRGHGRLRQPLPSSLRRCYFTFLLFTPRDFLWGLGQFAYILIYKKLSGAGCRSESDLPVLNLKELNNFPLLLRCVESDSCSSHHLSLEEGAGGLGGGEETSRTFTGSPQPHSAAVQAAEEPFSHPGHSGGKRWRDLGAGKDLVHLTVPNHVPSAWDTVRSRRCPG